MRRRVLSGGTPAALLAIAAALVSLSLAWGVAGALIVSAHASAASDVVTTGDTLRLDAQRLYESMADADVTATTNFLSGAQPSPSGLQRYQSDIAAAGGELSRLRTAIGAGRPISFALQAVSTGLPLYTAYVAQAQSYSGVGYALTGGSFMQVASEQAHVVLLPAAATIYADENAALTAASSRATGLPTMVILLVLALATGIALLVAQRWLTRRMNRVFNLGLVAATVALAVSALWLAVAFTGARADLDHAVDHGSGPAGSLARASIEVEQARGDEILNLISRTGDTSFVDDFQHVRTDVGPGAGTLLSTAAASSGPTAAAPVADAERAVEDWYATNDHVYRLDVSAAYADETSLVIGSGPGSSAPGFARVETDITHAITQDQRAFHADAVAGSDAFGPLEAVIILAAVLMAAGCAWGLSQRLAEYR